ncbi:hypothetical protein GF342_05255 [Candidatus Woesearchaeota archaeon]|nr:hypothetical protein [Candidatus Woesearchaeota archaeon]
MLARTHVAFGLFSAALAHAFIPIAEPLLFYALVAIGALLPDIDHQGSTINRVFPVTKIVGTFFRHRGFFHSVFPIALLLLITMGTGYARAGYYLGFGYFTHLLSDSFTRLGVNFLHPFSRLHARGFIDVGTLEETVFFVSVVAGLVLLLLY